MPARTRVYENGTIHALDAKASRPQAVAVRGERILAAGRAADVLTRAGADAERIDLRGHTLVPGLVDAHSHLSFVGRWARTAQLASPPVGSVTNMRELVEAFDDLRTATPRGGWLLGTGYDDTLLAEGRHPTRHDLDRVSSDHPVAALHVSGHLAAANTRALELAGIGRKTPDPPGGVIRRDAATGEPNGVLEEPAAFEPVLRLLPQPDPDERVSAIEHAAQSYLARGITTAQEGVAEVRTLEDLASCEAAGALPLRVVAWPSYRAFEQLGADACTELATGPRRRMGAIKLFADGSIQGYTGHLCQPYHTPFGETADYTGYAVLTSKELDERVLRVHEAGLQVACHANGDAAIDALLHALQAAWRSAPRSDARPVVVHAQTAREDQLDLMQELGAIPSFFVLHVYYWGDRHRDVFLGPERARRISPARSALDRGLRFTLHTDAPVVPMDPWLLLWSAIERTTSGGEVLGDEQRLAPIDALAATTRESAWQSFEEDSRGSIEPGKLADLAILSEDPLAHPERLRSLRVLETIVGGETAYRSPT